MAVTEDVYVKLKLDSTDFEKSMEKSTHDVNEFARELKTGKKGLAGMAGAMTALGVGAIGASVALVKMTNALADNVFEAERYANRLGISTKELLNLQSAASDFGVEAEDVSEGLKNMTERLGEALLEGRGASFDALARLGVNLEELEKLDTPSRLYKIAGALSEVESEAQKTYLNMEIFQEEGYKMQEMLDLGEQGLRDYVEAQNKYTDAIDVKELKEYRKELNELNKTFRTAGAMVSGFAVSSLTKLNETINTTAEKLFGIYERPIISSGQLERIKETTKELEKMAKVDPFVAMQKQAENEILDGNKGEKTVAQIAIESDKKHADKQRKDLEARKKEMASMLQEEMNAKDKLRDDLFSTWEEEDKRAAQQKQLNSASGAYQTSGVLERGSVSEASIGAGKANQYEIKSANTLDKMLQLMKKENRASQLIKVNQL